jgi:hypothetical protein
MCTFILQGPKNTEIKSYQTLNYVEKVVKELDIEKLNKYNHAIGLIFKWMTLAIATRKKDIIQRLVVSRRLREERDGKIEEEK